LSSQDKDILTAGDAGGLPFRLVHHAHGWSIPLQALTDEADRKACRLIGRIFGLSEGLVEIVSTAAAMGCRHVNFEDDAPRSPDFPLAGRRP
jgi:hypothetical protein